MPKVAGYIESGNHVRESCFLLDRLLQLLVHHGQVHSLGAHDDQLNGEARVSCLHLLLHVLIDLYMLLRGQVLLVLELATNY